jgi:hypothetical protein
MQQDWILRLKKLIAEERRITALVIAELERIQRFKLYAEMGYSSLFKFCVQELGYSESAAQRRILAMRLTRDVPEARIAIENGSLSLSTLSKVESFSRQQKIKDPKTKRELLNAVTGKSARRTEQYLASIAPKPISQESVRCITGELTELKFVVDEETIQMLIKIRNLWAHKNPHFTQAELLKEMARFVLGKIDLGNKRRIKTVKKGTLIKTLAQEESTLKTHSPLVPKRPTASAVKDSRYIPAKLRRMIWVRDKGRCQYRSQAGKLCGSTFNLEVDHVHPLTLGGLSTADNLRILCREHNQYSALKLRL